MAKMTKQTMTEINEKLKNILHTCKRCAHYDIFTDDNGRQVWRCELKHNYLGGCEDWEAYDNA